MLHETKKQIASLINAIKHNREITVTTQLHFFSYNLSIQSNSCVTPLIKSCATLRKHPRIDFRSRFALNTGVCVKEESMTSRAIDKHDQVRKLFWAAPASARAPQSVTFFIVLQRRNFVRELVCCTSSPLPNAGQL